MKKIMWWICGAVALLAGCSAPAPLVQQPLSVRPAVNAAKPQGASLFSEAGYRPLFEDPRARRVGDTLTVVIAENTTASKTSSADASRKAGISASVPTVNGVGIPELSGLAIGGTTDYSFKGSGDAALKNAFTGNVTVTVIEVLANGNLLVSGEKQVAINQGTEYVRFSGVVNPVTLVKNTVQSYQVADVRLEYKQDGALADAQKPGWLSRFFMNVLPF